MGIVVAIHARTGVHHENTATVLNGNEVTVPSSSKVEVRLGGGVAVLSNTVAEVLVVMTVAVRLDTGAEVLLDDEAEVHLAGIAAVVHLAVTVR